MAHAANTDNESQSPEGFAYSLPFLIVVGIPIFIFLSVCRFASNCITQFFVFVDNLCPPEEIYNQTKKERVQPTRKNKPSSKKRKRSTAQKSRRNNM